MASPISKRIFLSGHCDAMAAALCEHHGLRPALIEGMIECEDEEGLIPEPAHAVALIDADQGLYLDAEGIALFVANQSRAVFSARPQEIRLREVGYEELASVFTLEGLNEEALDEARRLIAEDPTLRLSAMIADFIEEEFQHLRIDSADDMRGQCDGVSERLFVYLAERGWPEPMGVLEAKGLDALPDDAAQGWAGFLEKPGYLSHRVVRVGDRVVDLTGIQFGARHGRLVQSLPEFATHWSEVRGTRALFSERARRWQRRIEGEARTSPGAHSPEIG